MARLLQGRSRRDWLVRIALALVASVLAIWSLQAALAQAIARADPSTAYLLAPGSAVAQTARAQTAMAMESSAAPDSLPARLARAAIRRDPTATDALTVLGLQAQLNNDTEAARRIFTYSLLLSRRELQARVWAIEEAVLRGDIAAAISNYDIALRTSKNAPDLLFPPLTAALDEPLVRKALLAELAQRPPWEERFVDHVGYNSRKPEAAIAFYREGERVNVPVKDANRAELVRALFARGKYAAAWDYYSSYRPGVRRDGSRNSTFAQPLKETTPFDWMPTDDTGLSADVVALPSGGALEFFSAPSTAGMLIRQAQFLPPGSYTIEGQSADIDQPERSRPLVTLTCVDGRELGRLALPNSSVDEGRFVLRVSVPANCPVQTLALVARPSDTIDGVTGRLTRFGIARARSDGGD